MSAPKFTPGPWVAALDRNNRPIVLGAGTQHIADCYHTPDGGGISNSRLIATAPELYEALNGLRTAMACHDSTPEEFLALANAVAALAKAAQP